MLMKTERCETGGRKEAGAGAGAAAYAVAVVGQGGGWDPGEDGWE